jgi:hypothetical protein
MAAKKPDAAPEPVAPKKTVQHPRYNVARLERASGRAVGEPLMAGDKLTIVEVDVRAKTALDACDDAIDRLPETDRGGEFGGFLSRSWKDDEWETETKTFTTRKSQQR